MENLILLLVEDDSSDALHIQEVLKDERDEFEESFVVEHVSDLKAAHERLEAGGVDIVLLDLGLPGKSGLDSFRETFEAYPDVPIVLLTGQGGGQIAFQALHEGAQDFLEKWQLANPMMSGTIMRSLREALIRRDDQESVFD